MMVRKSAENEEISVANGNLYNLTGSACQFDRLKLFRVTIMDYNADFV